MSPHNALSIKTIPRVCDLCKNADLSTVFERKVARRTRTSTYIWNNRTVMCRNCGFVFSSPAPCVDDLSAYYADSYTPYAKQHYDFSADIRIGLVKDYYCDNFTTFAEIGSNIATKFSESLKQIFPKMRLSP